ncbi:MAG: hypothetical protein MI784_11730 [Cytophagales bacterium]|nr:hypothetical protein [Cytophagales bacterium]
MPAETITQYSKKVAILTGYLLDHPNEICIHDWLEVDEFVEGIDLAMHQVMEDDCEGGRLFKKGQIRAAQYIADKWVAEGRFDAEYWHLL